LADLVDWALAVGGAATAVACATVEPGVAVAGVLAAIPMSTI
jgi:hypothetical protein